MIEARELRYTYPSGEFTLHIPELFVEPGEQIAIVGPSGSGKSTLLNLLAGILPAEGELVVAGQNLIALSDSPRRAFRASHVGFVFQDFALIPFLSVLDNILHPVRIGRGLKVEARTKERAMALAKTLGIEDKAARKPADLSHGERQRVSICRALINQPDIILADEPTGNLDLANKQAAMAVLQQQAAAAGANLVVVTHDADVLGEISRVIDFAQFQAAN